MRRLQVALLAAAAAIGFASIASAADMPAKAVMPVKAAPLPLAYNWSGIYIGGNIGVAWHDLDVNWPGGGGGFRDFNHKGSTGVAGAHVGIQYQWTNIVLGVEAAWFANFDNREFTGSPNTGCPNPVGYTCQAVTDSFWTVGPRLGWAANDWLFFVTGGYANGNVNAQAIGPVPDDVRTRHGGWFGGAGIEYVLWKTPTFDTILGAEYQHIDLGTVRLVSPVYTRDIESTTDVVRARLTFKANVLGR